MKAHLPISVLYIKCV